MSEPSKDHVRKVLLGKRRQMTSEKARMDSSACIKNLIELLSQSKILDDPHEGVIGLYRPMTDEPVLEDLVAWALKKKKKIAFPRLIRPSMKQGDSNPNGMDFFLGNGTWESGPLGILQPGLDATRVSPQELGWILVPGVGFDRAGHRIGMGKGFYDGYLKLAPRAVRMVVTFSFQLLDQATWKPDPWDERVDLIATESEVFWVKPGRIQRVFAD